MYDQGHRAGATRGNYVKVTAGESMQFRVLGVHPIREVDGGQNGPYDCSPHDVAVAWHKDARGSVTYPKGEGDKPLSWEPASEKIDGLIKLADQLSRATGNDRELMNHDVIVEVVQEQNPKNKRWFHVYQYRLAGPMPAAGQAPRTPAAPAAVAPPPAPGGVPAAAVPTSNIVATLTAAFGQQTTLEGLEAEARRQWPQVQASKATAEVTRAFNARKLAIAGGELARAPTQADLDAAWGRLAPKFERNPADLQTLTEAYQARAGQLAGGGAHDQPFFEDAPADDIPF